FVNEWTKYLGKADIESVRKHWGGPGGLAGVARGIPGWIKAYNTVYRELSQAAHGSDPSAHVMPPSHNATGATFPILPGPAECDRVLMITNLLLFTITEKLNVRFGLGLEAQLRASQITQRG